MHAALFKPLIYAIWRRGLLSKMVLDIIGHSHSYRPKSVRIQDIEYNDFQMSGTRLDLQAENCEME